MILWQAEWIGVLLTSFARYVQMLGALGYDIELTYVKREG